MGKTALGYPGYPAMKNQTKLIVLFALVAISLQLNAALILQWSNGSFEEGDKDWTFTTSPFDQTPRVVYGDSMFGNYSVSVPQFCSIEHDFTIYNFGEYLLTYWVRDETKAPGTPPSPDGIWPGGDWKFYSIGLTLPPGTYSMSWGNNTTTSIFRVDGFGTAIPEPNGFLAIGLLSVAFVVWKRRRL